MPCGSSWKLSHKKQVVRLSKTCELLDDAAHEILDNKNYPLPLSKSVADAISSAGAGLSPSSVPYLAYVKFKRDPASFVFAAADEIFNDVQENVT